VLEGGILVLFLPDRQDLLCFTFTVERAEDDVIQTAKVSDTVFRYDAEGFFGGNHHQDALVITGTK